MKVLHLLAMGGIGGIENLMKEYGGFSRNDNTFLFLRSGGTIYEEMKASGMHVIDWNVSRTEYLYVPFRVLKFIRDNHYTVVVTHHEAPIIHLSSILVSLFCRNIRVYTYLHSSAEDTFHVGEYREFLYRPILGMSYRLSHRTIAISKYAACSLINLIHLSPEKITVLYNGVDISTWQNVQQRTVNQELRIVYVGRLIKPKGVEHILRGLAKLAPDVQYHFWAIGDGPEKEALICLAEELGIQSRVSFPGYVRNVVDYLKKADVFVHMPNWQEGFGMTVVEAMACGLLCIVNDHGALPEIVEDGISGFVLSDPNETCFSEVITKIWPQKDTLYREGTELYQIRQNAIRQADKFRMEHFAGSLDKLLEN